MYPSGATDVLSWLDLLAVSNYERTKFQANPFVVSSETTMWGLLELVMLLQPQAAGSDNGLELRPFAGDTAAIRAVPVSQDGAVLKADVHGFLVKARLLSVCAAADVQKASMYMRHLQRLQSQANGDPSSNPQFRQLLARKLFADAFILDPDLTPTLIAHCTSALEQALQYGHAVMELPSYAVDDPLSIILYYAQFADEQLDRAGVEIPDRLIALVVDFLRASELVSDPHVRAKFGQVSVRP